MSVLDLGNICDVIKVLSQLAKGNLVRWYLVQVPFMFSRHALHRAIGYDRLSEDGSVLIVAKGGKSIRLWPFFR